MKLKAQMAALKRAVTASTAVAAQLAAHLASPGALVRLDARGTLVAARDLSAGTLVSLVPGLLYPAPPGGASRLPAQMVDEVGRGAEGGDDLVHSYTLGTTLPCTPEREHAIALADGAVLDTTPSCLAACCVVQRRAARSSALGHRVAIVAEAAYVNTVVADLGHPTWLPAKLTALVPTVPSAWSHAMADGTRVPLDRTADRAFPRAVALVTTTTVAAGHSFAAGRRGHS